MERITFEPTGKPVEVGDFVMAACGDILCVDSPGYHKICRSKGYVAYRRVESQACDGKVLEVASALYLKHSEVSGQDFVTRKIILERCVADARALIAACGEVSDGK